MKARSEATELNLDSLMDTVTNVVGILVLILVLITLNIKKTVQRIRQEDPSQFGVSRAQLAEIQQQASQQRETIEQLRQQADNLDVRVEQDEQAIVKQQQLIEQLRREKPQQDPKKVIEQREKKEEQLAEIEKDLEAVQGELGRTPERTAPPPKIVHLPNPRDAPKGAQPILFICREGRLLVFDPEELKDRVEKRVQFLLRPFTAKAGPGGEIDCQKLVQTYNKEAVSNSEFRSQLVVENYRLVLVYEFRSGGETPDRLGNSSSRFQATIRRMEPDKNYARFLVWPDSFDVYVEARTMCDQRGVLAGWEPYTEDYQWKIPLGLKVTCQGKPKPPATSPTDKSAPKPPAPPLPKDVID